MGNWVCNHNLHWFHSKTGQYSFGKLSFLFTNIYWISIFPTIRVLFFWEACIWNIHWWCICSTCIRWIVKALFYFFITINFLPTFIIVNFLLATKTILSLHNKMQSKIMLRPELWVKYHKLCDKMGWCVSDISDEKNGWDFFFPFSLRLAPF